MTLPPPDTPIKHNGSHICPVHPETRVSVTFIDGKKAENRPAGWWVWSKVTTYTITAPAPAQTDRTAELEAALGLAANRLEQCSVMLPKYALIRQSAIDWCAEARAILKGETNDRTE